ncbi:dihydrodipicolinate synthase family protein [Planctomicrobium sp. SH661]|uniref:dihydrodipicolinate synthase family protein n=1 Tax=Planctomicrobium sp. SH661 TaxID=3448124 RepID=UPI003F5C62E9
MMNRSSKIASLSRLTGVLPVFQTPYHEDGTIDTATLEREIDWLFEQGSDGIVMAMVSEILRLDEGERRSLAELACRRAQGRGTVVISVGAESTAIAVKLTRHATEAGATALMAIPPVSVAPLEDELLHYYEAIVQATPLPVVVQDASGYVGRPMSIAFQAKLLELFGKERILFKPEATPIGPRLSQLRDATSQQGDIFEGTGGIALVDSYRRGIVGTMPGADLIGGIVALWRALQAGDDRRAYQLSLPISAIVALQNSLDAFLAIEKYLLVKQGVFRNTYVRGPRAYILDRETQNEVDRLFNLMIGQLGESR